MTRVVVVDDQEVVRSGFGLILERAGLEVVGEAADGLKALEVVATCVPDVVLMDVRMPRLDGIEATRRMVNGAPGACRSWRSPRSTSTSTSSEHCRPARAGSCSRTSPGRPRPRRGGRGPRRGDARAGGDQAAARTVRLAARAGGLPALVAGLRRRELEVLGLVARGLPNGAIGTELFLSEATVKTHVSTCSPSSTSGTGCSSRSSPTRPGSCAPEQNRTKRSSASGGRCVILVGGDKKKQLPPKRTPASA